MLVIAKRNLSATAKCNNILFGERKKKERIDSFKENISIISLCLTRIMYKAFFIIFKTHYAL